MSQTVEIAFHPANEEQRKAEITAEHKYVAMQYGSGEEIALPRPLYCWLLGVLSQEGWCEGAPGTDPEEKHWL